MKVREARDADIDAIRRMMLDAMFAVGLSRIELGTDPGTRAEVFYWRAGWEAMGTDSHGELRFEITKEQHEQARWS